MRDLREVVRKLALEDGRYSVEAFEFIFESLEPAVRLAGREKPLQILFFNNSLGVAIATIAVIAVWQPPTPAQWAALAALGTLMAAAQACFVNSVARADASFVTPFSYLTLVFAAVYDFAIFGVTPTGLSYLGAGTIIAGAALLAWREALLKAPAKAP